MDIDKLAKRLEELLWQWKVNCIEEYKMRCGNIQPNRQDYYNVIWRDYGTQTAEGDLKTYDEMCKCAEKLRILIEANSEYQKKYGNLLEDASNYINEDMNKGKEYLIVGAETNMILERLIENLKEENTSYIIIGNANDAEQYFTKHTRDIATVVVDDMIYLSEGAIRCNHDIALRLINNLKQMNKGKKYVINSKNSEPPVITLQSLLEEISKRREKEKQEKEKQKKEMAAKKTPKKNIEIKPYYIDIHDVDRYMLMKVEELLNEEKEKPGILNEICSVCGGICRGNYNICSVGSANHRLDKDYVDIRGNSKYNRHIPEL